MDALTASASVSDALSYITPENSRPTTPVCPGAPARPAPAQAPVQAPVQAPAQAPSARRSLGF
jgi:hypothetical protein